MIKYTAKCLICGKETEGMIKDTGDAIKTKLEALKRCRGCGEKERVITPVGWASEQEILEHQKKSPANWPGPRML